eukprot:5326884-Amphidinium_carterae.1
MSTSALRQKLIKMKLMSNPRTSRYIRCTVCHRVLNGSGGVKNPRCNNRNCYLYRKCVNNYLNIFAAGERAHPLTSQALIAYCAIVGMKQGIAHLCFDLNHKSIERIYGNLYNVMANKVRGIQDTIVFNDTNQWVDVEADEVILRKTSVGESP